MHSVIGLGVKYGKVDPLGVTSVGELQRRVFAGIVCLQTVAGQPNLAVGLTPGPCLALSLAPCLEPREAAAFRCLLAAIVRPSGLRFHEVALAQQRPASSV